MKEIKRNIDSLIRKSRHYCLDNREYWYKRYQLEKSESSDYSNSYHNLLTRQNYLSVLLDEIEYIIEDQFDSIIQCKELLIVIGENAASTFAEGKKNKMEQEAIKEERLKFIKFIHELSIEDLKNVPALFYRKNLSKQESKEIRQQLLVNWNFDGSYWEPLKKCSPRPFIFLFGNFLTKSDYEEISRIIIQNSEAKIYGISEDRKDIKIESKNFKANDVYETVYTDHTLDWIFYGSHENSIAVGGEQQIAAIRAYLKERTEIINKW